VASPGDGIRRIERFNYGIGAVVVAGGALTQARPIALGLAVGVALTCANFFVLRKLVVKWTSEAASGRGGNAAMLMLPKMVGLMAAVGLAIVFLPMSVVAFTVGYSIFLVSIVVEVLYSAIRTPDGAPPAGPNNGEHEHHHG
jgi:hypothetical protein